MKVGFLLPRDDVHHVAHIMPIARQLARDHPGCSVIIATSSSRSGDAVDLAAGADEASNLLQLRTHSSASPNEIFPSLDALIISDPTALSLQRSPRFSGCRFIGVVIGASDHGLTPAEAWRGGDHLLVQGEKTGDRLSKGSVIDPRRISVVGCAKLDERAHVPWRAQGATRRTTVLYNPHYDPAISSWFRWGADILDWFAGRDDYDLIFAPHVRLFDRRFIRAQGAVLPQRVRRVEERWWQAPNIFIDLSSQASVGRSYTDRADIYLGDGGAQLYEFLERPRPCAFLNAQAAPIRDQDPRRFNWGAGPVISDIALLGALLETTQEWHSGVYRPVQEQMFAYSLSVTDQPAAQRAARAIADVISAGRQTRSADSHEQPGSPQPHRT